MKATTRSSLLRRSFTLLELLLILALVFGITVLAAGGGTMVLQATAVTTSAAMLDDALTQGRARAVGQNTTVEVRLYDVPPQVGASPAYSALQLHWLKSDGTTPAVAAPVLLSSWVSIDATAAHSSLIASNTQTPTPDASDTRLNAQTRVFHFLPDGSTDLNPATNWFLTVRPANQSAPANFPSNWACIQIDSATGRVQIYRP
jgi:uncharacterized protein (TIGR02596 family)